MNDSDPEQDVEQIAALGRELAQVDLEDAHIQRISALTRQQVGRRPSARRYVEPIGVAVLSVSIVVWVVLKLIEILR